LSRTAWVTSTSATTARVIPGSIRKIAPPLPRFSATELLIASEDGREVYVFNLYGRHLRTLHPLTGAILYEFTYDSAGRLTQVTDGDNNVTAVQRNGAGNPTAIVGPFGQSTALTLNANGFLTNIADPANQTYQFSYTADGLMTGETDPRTNSYSFIYDSLGRLTKDTDPATGFKNLARTDQNITSYSVAVTTALNRTNTYQVQTLATGDQKRIYTDPAGLQTQLVEGLDAKNTTTYPEGMVTTVQLGGRPALEAASAIGQGHHDHDTGRVGLQFHFRADSHVV
jgi:YD repeat-containing protein